MDVLVKMLKLRSLFQSTDDGLTPIIFADLLIDIDGEIQRIDVETPDWLPEIEPQYKVIDRIGLALKNQGPAVWLATNGEARYFSRVIGQIDERGHRRIRVAGITNGKVSAWLHLDGLVEVQSEPSWRE